MFFFKRKTAKCRLCGISSPLKKMWDVKIKTSESDHEIKLCEYCADELSKMKDEQNG
jgi:hypothetical protein